MTLGLNSVTLQYDAELTMAEAVAEGERQRLARLARRETGTAGLRGALASWLLWLAFRIDARAGRSAAAVAALKQV